MTELLLSEITRMGTGFCIIGLEATPDGYRSLRPLPRFGNAWPAALPHRRGWRVECELSTIPVVPPHVEDRPSSGRLRRVGEFSEEELVRCLRRAELAEHIRELFGCLLQENRAGRGFYAEPNEAVRSICGVEIQNVHFMMRAEELRAELIFRDGGRLKLPVVDAAWKEYVERAIAQIVGANREQRLQKFLSSRLPSQMLAHTSIFARIGLTRPFMDKCWLMLDSLFPQPREEWLEELQ